MEADLDPDLEAIEQRLAQTNSEPSSSEYSHESSEIDPTATALPVKKSRPRERSESESSIDANELDEAHLYLIEEQRRDGLQLIERLEALDGDGDTIDLRTGRIVNSVGHLNALPTRRGYLSDVDTEESDDNGSEDDEPAETLEPSVFRDLCVHRTPVVDSIVLELAR